MKASEFRIGNWFYSKAKGRQEQVEGHHFAIHHGESKGETNYYLDIHAEPIPLTEEWLVKFGFVKDSEHEKTSVLDVDSIYINQSGYSITVTGVSIQFSYPSLYAGEIDIEHVHQLQNLYFALTGKELEVIK